MEVSSPPHKTLLPYIALVFSSSPLLHLARSLHRFFLRGSQASRIPPILLAGVFIVTTSPYGASVNVLSSTSRARISHTHRSYESLIDIAHTHFKKVSGRHKRLRQTKLWSCRRETATRRWRAEARGCSCESVLRTRAIEVMEFEGGSI